MVAAPAVAPAPAVAAPAVAHGAAVRSAVRDRRMEAWQQIRNGQSGANLRSLTLLKMSGCMAGCLIVWGWSMFDAGRSIPKTQTDPAPSPEPEG